MEREIEPNKNMEILDGEVYKCDLCDNHTGWVIEKYNGGVEVMCMCDVDEYQEDKRPIPNPGMICRSGVLRWRPISEYKDSTGRSWHVPYFG